MGESLPREDPNPALLPLASPALASRATGDSFAPPLRTASEAPFPRALRRVVSAPFNPDDGVKERDGALTDGFATENLGVRALGVRPLDLGAPPVDGASLGIEPRVEKPRGDVVMEPFGEALPEGSERGAIPEPLRRDGDVLLKDVLGFER